MGFKGMGGQKMSPLLIVYLSFLIIVGLGAFIYLRQVEKKSKSIDNKKNKSKSLQTAQELINIVDIQNQYLTTRDGYVFSFINIEPINVDLMGGQNLKYLTQRLSAEISGVSYPFYLLANSKPMDLDDVLVSYKTGIVNTDVPERKQILKNEIIDLTKRLDNNEIPIRNFTLIIWSEDDEDGKTQLKKRAEEMIVGFKNAGVVTHLLGQQEIVRLINLINNPSFNLTDDEDFWKTGMMELINQG